MPLLRLEGTVDLPCLPLGGVRVYVGESKGF
jgi:hypothetical protein